MVDLSIKAIGTSKDDDELFDLRIWFRESKKARESTGEDVKKDLEKTVATWTKKPKFIVLTKQAPNEHSVNVTTTNKIYHFLNEGTGVYGPLKRPIVIRPVKAKVLRFFPNYKAKTSSHPRAIQAKAGGRNTSGKPVFAQEVIVQGIKPRRFFDKIARRNEKRFQDKIDKALNLALRGK